MTGSAGAVGGYPIIAKAAGYRVLADGAAKDVELLRGLGAEVIVERDPRVGEAIRQACPEGVDALIDAAVQGAAVLVAVLDGGTSRCSSGLWRSQRTGHHDSPDLSEGLFVQSCRIRRVG